MHSFFSYNKAIQILLFLTSINSLLSIDETEIEIPYTIKSNNLFELNSYYIIAKISYTKSHSNINNYFFGIFLASNNTNILSTIPIGIIKSQNATLIQTNTPFPSKYIYYIPPNKNNISITPLKIFGYINLYLIKNTYYFQVTNLPLLLINTEKEEEPLNKERYIQSKIIIINKGQIVLNESAGIKVRGHSTAGTVKMKKNL